MAMYTICAPYYPGGLFHISYHTRRRVEARSMNDAAGPLRTQPRPPTRGGLAYFAMAHTPAATASTAPMTAPTRHPFRDLRRPAISASAAAL